MWIPLTLITTLLWGIGEVAARRGMERISPAWNNVFAAFIAASIWIPFVWRADPASIRFVWSDFLLACVIAVLYWSYYYGLSKGKLAIASALMATYPITTVILSVTILHEQLTVHHITAIATILLGIMFVSSPDTRVSSNIKTRRVPRFSWLYWGLGCSILFGIAEFLGKVGVMHAGSFSFIYSLALAYIVTAGFNFIVDPKGFHDSPLRYPKLFWYLVFGTAAVEIGTIFEFMALGLGQGPASLVIPITASSVVIIVLGARIFLHEHISLLQWLGIILTISGVVIIGL